MNIAPSPLPAAALTTEAPRPVQPPTHESSRPVLAPNPVEAMAQEASRNDARRTGHDVEREIEHDRQAHGQHARQRLARAATATEPATPAEPHPRSLTVGRLLDVFA